MVGVDVYSAALYATAETAGGTDGPVCSPGDTSLLDFRIQRLLILIKTAGSGSVP